jgi:hypothetical protein
VFRLVQRHHTALLTALAVTGSAAVSAATDSGYWSTLAALASALIYLGFSALVWLLPVALISALIDLFAHYYQETAMSGYANRVITLSFPELTEPGEPEIHVIMRNPRLMPPAELAPQNVELDENNQPKDFDAAKTANDTVLAKLVIGWRAYDASDIQVDEDGNVLPQAPLPLPANAELVGKLPAAIFMRMIREVTDAVDPQ